MARAHRSRVGGVRARPAGVTSLVLAKIHSFILVGIDPLLCEVEVDVSDRGMDRTVVVGLPQAAVKESIERVRRAVINSGYAFPHHSLLVNLAPADVKKEGPALDLAMAVGVLRGLGVPDAKIAVPAPAAN